MATQWYAKRRDKEYGPIQFCELVELARSGDIGRFDFVRSTWHKEWQPAATVLNEFLAVESTTERGTWSEAVTAAVEASKARHSAQNRERGVAQRREVGLFVAAWSIFRGLMIPILWMWHLLRWSARQFEPHWDWLSQGLSFATGSVWWGTGIRVVFTLVSAALTGMVLREWSSEGALGQVWRTSGSALGAPAYFPGIGPCGEFEYWFLFIDVVVAVAVASYFVVGFLAESGE